MRKFTQQLREIGREMGADIRQTFRGVINLAKSADNIQKVQVSGLADELLQDVELMQHFGFTSVPPANTQAVIIPVGGKTSHGVVVATENGAFRVKNLQGGEVAIYDESGSSIILKQGRLIEIDCDILKIKAQTKVDIASPLVETSEVFTAQGMINSNGGMAVQGGEGASFSGNVKQTNGNFTTSGDVVAGNTSLVNHTHNGDSGGKTSQPI